MCQNRIIYIQDLGQGKEEKLRLGVGEVWKSALSLDKGQ